MDTTGATGTIDPKTGDATATQDAGSSSSAEPVASESSQGQEDNAGGEQSFSESGKANGTDTRKPQFRSKNQTIFELRQKLREQDSRWGTEVDTLKSQIAEIQKLFGRGQERKPSRTFYEAPEDTLREINSEQLSAFKEDLLNELRSTQQERDQQLSLKQEASEAAKFIRSQKGITEDEIQEIRELLQTDSVAQSLANTPMDQANYVWYLFEKQRGVTDKTALKDKARGVTGASVSTGGSAKTWTEAEMEKEVQKLGDVKNWGPEQKAKYKQLESEFMRAYADGRVKK